MRGKGINYDTGFSPAGDTSRPEFSADQVRAELRVIAEELNCTAVRISGGDPERLSVAAACAAELGLEIWFAPFPCNMTAEQMLPWFEDCARRAERVRAGGAEVVLVTGCELSIFAHGFLPGDGFAERVANAMAPDPELFRAYGNPAERLSAFLAEVAARARLHFGGPLSYAAGPWEEIDWTPFDLVGVDAYRDERNAGHYRQELRAHFAHGKPVVVTEFGCCAYQGAAARGGMGWDVVDHEVEPRRIRGESVPVRDEQEQVRYLHELLAVFEEEGVDAAFWFTFAAYGAPHDRDDPRFDLDLGSYGVVRMVPGGGRPGLGWEPKAAFAALAEAYAERDRARAGR
ncbi:hypothetical protein P3T37_007111 [Kitasatospora sp. MAA4]|uniref:hypothetical protein n=1 Tax=Kitasatospora sp. MAA4 TaxID=3035093 RepID=UPI002475A877|nr:hypothetical protein [Kitasatospora sp. MAA4]MDH6137678.1 hypothetical protein [Kitasatospora sp. MAA4]